MGRIPRIGRSRTLGGPRLHFTSERCVIADDSHIAVFDTVVGGV